MPDYLTFERWHMPPHIDVYREVSIREFFSNWLKNNQEPTSLRKLMTALCEKLLQLEIIDDNGTNIIVNETLFLHEIAARMNDGNYVIVKGMTEYAGTLEELAGFLMTLKTELSMNSMPTSGIEEVISLCLECLEMI